MAHKNLHENTLEDEHVASSTISTTSNCSSEVFEWKTSSTEFKQRQITESNWGRHALYSDLWEITESPIVQIRSSEILLDNKECCGFLSDRIIGIGSSSLTRSPENGLYIFNKCIMRKRNLTNIVILKYHRYLQYIDIAYNKVKCLSSLSKLPYLMYLNASHNKIKHISNFIAPWYLTDVNLSYNYITNIGDLKNCWSIIKLNLSHNVIEKISDLENLKYLQHLDLSYNLIECIENLDGLNIQELNLEGNCIIAFKSAISSRGTNILPNLKTIILSYNRLSILEFFKDLYSLRFVDLKFNKISNLLEVLNLKGMIYEIDLRGNTCTKWPNYRSVLISSVSSVAFIDGIEVSAAEKVMSAKLFAPSLDLTAACNVTKLTLLEQLNINKIHAHIQPYDEMYLPLIILTGPSAVKKMALALHITQTLYNKIKYCRWHTTQEVYEDNNERNAYIIVSKEEFNDMVRRGEFVVIIDFLGHNYGFHIEQITLLISENKIGLTEMDLYATIEISKRYPNVKTILVLTHSLDLHKIWIHEKFDVYTWIKDSLDNLLAVKIGKHIDDNKAESASSILNLIEDILDKIIERLELPDYNTCIRPQGTGATTTDIILESKMMLPKIIIKRSQILSERKKRIIFQENNKYNIINSLHKLSEESAIEKLKVLLDEDLNIIIDDKKSKREMYKTKMLHRRSKLQVGTVNDFDYNGSKSTSTDELTDPYQGKTIDKTLETLKNIYTKFVLKSRKLYLDYHDNHPGFFVLVLLMDDYTKAFNLLSDFIHESYVSHFHRKSMSLSEINYITQTAIPNALENIINEIKEHQSSKFQQKLYYKHTELH